MTHGKRSEFPSHDSGPDPLLELVAEAMRDRAEPRPVDNEAFLRGARSRAARIRRRRRSAAAVAAVVVLAVPIGVLGRDLIGRPNSTITAEGTPGSG